MKRQPMVGRTPLLTPLPEKPPPLSRLEARKNWELIAAGISLDQPELGAWLRHVALAIVQADDIPTTETKDRNRKPTAFIEACGLGGKKRETDPAQVAQCLRAYKLAREGKAAYVNSRDAVDFVARKLRWGADVDAVGRVKEAIRLLPTAQRGKLLAIVRGTILQSSPP